MTSVAPSSSARKRSSSARQDALRVPVGGAADLGRLHGAAGAVEQRRAEPLLERADGERDRGLRDAELLGGLRERRAVDDGHEGRELPGVHQPPTVAGSRPGIARTGLRTVSCTAATSPSASPASTRASSTREPLATASARRSGRAARPAASRAACARPPRRPRTAPRRASRPAGCPVTRISTVLARQPHHVLRELHDRHGLAHVEHEDVARLADAAGLDHQLRGLRDRHEVARHPRVGDGDRDRRRRSARGRSGSRSRTTPSTLPNRTAMNRVSRLGLRRRLDDPLAERLGGAHHGLRVDGLVGGDRARSARRRPRATMVARSRVASVLLRIASSGFCSITGTCL